MGEKHKALFVCLGNICRSPIAEGVFAHLIKERKLEDKWVADSAAIGSWHAGNSPDHRTSSTLEKHSVSYNGKARQIKSADFNEFDYVFGMDEENIADLKQRAPKNCKAKILLLGEFDPEGDRIIRDPYYDSGADGFEKCYQQCMRSCNAFLDKHN